MKTIELKLYSFNELSKEAQKKVVDSWEPFTDYITSEAFDAAQKFFALFNSRLTSLDFDREEWSCSGLPDNLLEVSGLRLATWLQNNVADQLFKPKYLKCFDGHKKHKMCANRTAKRTGKRYCFAYSNVQRVSDCPLTGVCYDYSILKPLLDFMSRPDNTTTARELIGDCLQSLCKDVTAEIEYLSTPDAVSEECAANDYMFTAEGKM